MALEVLAGEVGHEKDIKGIQTGKEGETWSLLTTHSSVQNTQQAPPKAGTTNK